MALRAHDATQVEAVFSLYDTDGNGAIDRDEMEQCVVVCSWWLRARSRSPDTVARDLRKLTELPRLGFPLGRYLAGVYRTVFFADSSLQEQAQCTPEELAAATTQSCFAEADLDGDGKLSLKEFQLWTDRSQQG